MATCKTCGTELVEGNQICPFCGANNAEQAAAPQQNVGNDPYAQQGQTQNQNYGQQNQNFNQYNGQAQGQNFNQYNQQAQGQNFNQYNQQQGQNFNQYNQQAQGQNFNQYNQQQGQNFNQYNGQGQYQNNNQQYNSYNQGQQNQGNFFDNFTNTPDFTATIDPADAAQNKGVSICAYISLLFLIPLCCAQNSRFARFHANQGFILWLASLIWGVGSAIITFALAFTGIGVLTVMVGLISKAGTLLIFVFMILGIINAADGKAKELPIIGKFRLIK